MTTFVKDLNLAPITLIINRGHEDMDYKDIFRLDSELCRKQGEFSVDRQKFHPKTPELLDIFFNQSTIGQQLDIDHLLKHELQEGKTKSHMELIAIGMIEATLWTMETMKKHKKFFPIAYYHIEAHMHPCYQAQIATIVTEFMKIGKQMEKDVQEI